MTDASIDKLTIVTQGFLIIPPIIYITLPGDWAWRTAFERFISEKHPALTFLVTDFTVMDMSFWAEKMALSLGYRKQMESREKTPLLVELYPCLKHLERHQEKCKLMFLVAIQRAR